jgi:hypothetical protein
MSPSHLNFKQRLARVIYFFPIQLLWVQFKKNHIILFFWFILFGYVSGQLAAKYGVPYLFLFPEYLGKVNFTSHLLLGFSCGGFIMAFNISAYIINGFRFPFLATLSRPFVKFCYNNFILPFVFIAVYLYQLYHFQTTIELEPQRQVLINILGFLSGNTIFILLSFLYFLTTNKNIFSIFSFVENKSFAENEKDKDILVKDVLHKNRNWKSTFNYDREWRVETYITNPFKIALARGSEHYDKSMLQSVFSQNHINASLFEILIVISFLTIGFFGEYSILIIPAAASVFLLFTMLLMLSSAIHSWFKGWSITIFIGLVLLLNFLTKIDALNYTNYAYGLNYNDVLAKYDFESMDAQRTNRPQIEKDKAHAIQTLENWRKNTGYVEKKPKIIFISTSGGGLRSALWTTVSLQYADSILNGKLLKLTHLITGSSGGMIGAAFLRENYLKNWKEEDSGFSRQGLTDHISKDLLNPVTFTMVFNDLTIHLKTIEYGGYEYTLDRGYSFEKQLISNTAGFLDKKLYDYEPFESAAVIPTMIFAPTIINDGRRLLISSQPISYMTDNQSEGMVMNDPLPECVDFYGLLAQQDAKNISFTSVLRMNATFPYIMPMVSLPTEPEVKIMDAGIRDNFGLNTALKYHYTFQDWIKENTSGVILLQVRAFKKGKIKSNYPKTALQNFSSPLGNFYSNWTDVQTFEQDQALQYAGSWSSTPVEVVTLQLKNEEEKALISLSWHLTEVEKELIKEALNDKENQLAIQRLQELLND